MGPLGSGSQHLPSTSFLPAALLPSVQVPHPLVTSATSPWKMRLLHLAVWHLGVTLLGSLHCNLKFSVAPNINHVGPNWRICGSSWIFLFFFFFVPRSLSCPESEAPFQHCLCSSSSWLFVAWNCNVSYRSPETCGKAKAGSQQKRVKFYPGIHLLSQGGCSPCFMTWLVKWSIHAYLPSQKCWSAWLNKDL